jgi:Skp family chaperone for outer membrane proteins
MNRTFSLHSALVAGLVTAVSIAAPVVSMAQAAPAAPATQAPPPQAIPAKIALINFEGVVFATNEGQKTVQDMQAKYAPKKAEIDKLAAEVDSLKKQAEAGKATMPPEEYASRVRTIDTKEKQLNLDADNATSAYNADLQDAYTKVAAKVNSVMQNYAQLNGYTLVLDVGNQQSPVVWAVTNTDISAAIVAAYNASSGVAAPPPSAPSASKPKPATGTAPKPMAPSSSH